MQVPVGLQSHPELGISEDGDDYSHAARSVLSTVQDLVSEELREPWPHKRKRPREMALPGTVVRNGVLVLWYGDEDAPVLTFPPVDLRAP
jgi:hypothetical protein